MTVTHTVAAVTEHVKVAIAPGVGDDRSEVGSLLVRSAALDTLDGPRLAAPLLSNPAFDAPARLGTVVLAPLEDTWQQFRPRLAAATDDWQRYPLYAALLFPGFWGNFGWLQAPLPVSIYGTLAVVCLAGLVGAWLVLRDRSGPLRYVTASWLGAAGLALLLALLPMIGRDWQPQGRYLFGALVPITGLLLIGLDRLLDFELHPRRAGALLAAAGLLCLAGLLRTAGIEIPAW